MVIILGMGLQYNNDNSFFHSISQCNIFQILVNTRQLITEKCNLSYLHDFLLQGIFPTQESNPGLPHCRQMLYRLSHQGSPIYSYRHILFPRLSWYLSSVLIYRLFYMEGPFEEGI